MANKKRLIWIDSLKGWLILIVIFGHAIQYCLPDKACENSYLWNLIYSFHMPAFMVVSGFVNYRPASETKITRRGGYLNICKRRSYQLLLPYLLWSLIKWVISANHSLDSLINITFTSGGFFWFLWALWSISLIFLLGCYISDRIKIRQEIVIGLFSMLLIGTMVIFELRKFGFQYISYYFLFYAFGYYCNKYNRQAQQNFFQSQTV